MSEPIRVLQVFGRLDRGGAESMLMSIYRNIDRTKVQFDFIVHTDDECVFDGEVCALGGKIYSMPRYKGINHFAYKKAWHEFFLSHGEYRIIHGHVRSTASIYLKIAKSYGLSTIIHSHSTSSGSSINALVKGIYQSRITKAADTLFACSTEAGNWLFKKNFIVFKNAINTSQFVFSKHKRKQHRNSMGLTNKYVIGHVGRFVPQKNHDFLIDIFAEVYSRNNNSVLILIGTGPLEEKTRKKVSNMGLDEAVIFTGVRSDVNELLQVMDVLVFPSLNEGLPVTVIEAQAAGLPCYISDTITNEVCVTPLVTRLPINSGTEIWVNAIESANIERKDMSEQIKNAGYDIKQSTDWITQFYYGVMTYV